MRETITITGNIATAPQQRRLPKGDLVTSFRVGSTERYFDRQANAWVDSPTNWFDVSAFRGLSDHTLHSLKLGERVILSGKLKVRNWSTGEKSGTAVEIEVEAIGHDLRWGTSTFFKDERAQAPESGEGSTDSWAVTTPGSDANGWTVPGGIAAIAENTAPSEPAERAEADPELILVAGDTPF